MNSSSPASLSHRNTTFYIDDNINIGTISISTKDVLGITEIILTQRAEVISNCNLNLDANVDEICPTTVDNNIVNKDGGQGGKPCGTCLGIC